MAALFKLMVVGCDDLLALRNENCGHRLPLADWDMQLSEKSAAIPHSLDDDDIAFAREDGFAEPLGCLGKWNANFDVDVHVRQPSRAWA